MGALFSRGGMFLTYEKSLERISQESNKLLARRGKRRTLLNGYRTVLLNAVAFSLVPCIAWVAYLRQQANLEYTVQEYFARTTLPFLIPAVIFLGSAILGKVLQVMERWEDKALKKLDTAKKKLIKELKDTTNFEKTMALLKKYDPDVQVRTPVAQQRGPAAPNNKTKTAGVAAAASALPGSLLMTALDSVGAFATKVIGDNPALLDELRKAQSAAMGLKQQNDILREKLEQLCIKHNEELPPFLHPAGLGFSANGTVPSIDIRAAPDGLGSTGGGAALLSLEGPGSGSEPDGPDPRRLDAPEGTGVPLIETRPAPVRGSSAETSAHDGAPAKDAKPDAAATASKVPATSCASELKNRGSKAGKKQQQQAAR